MHRIWIIVLCLAGAGWAWPAGQKASVPASDVAAVAGEWRGESLCLVKPSPCHDEVVVYHVTKAGKAGMLAMQADKIVNGEAQDMGTLDCEYDFGKHTLTCTIPRGVFRFTVSGDKMEGTLTTSDNVLFRRISVKKAR